MSTRIEGRPLLPFPRLPENPAAGTRLPGNNIDDRTLGQLLKLLGTAPADESLGQIPLPAQKPGVLPPMIQAYDRYARKLEIPRETWRQAVLEPAFKQHETNPQALSRLILQALTDGFIEEALPPAQQLVKIDPNVLRSSSILSSVLLQLKRFSEVLDVLEPVIADHGEEGSVLLRIAQAYAGLGQTNRSETILSRALTLDPNHAQGVEWYAAIWMARDGQEGQLAAYRRIAQLPGSWLAQLWLAKAALENQDLDGAMTLYKEVLSKLADIPEEVLIQISNDLAQRGALRQMLDLIEPRFDAAKHGLLVGANLIAAHLDLEDTSGARRILEILYALQRPEWREHLLYWQKRIDNPDYGNVRQPRPPAFEWLRLGNPVWAYGDPAIEALLPPKAPDACRIVLVCGSASAEASRTDEVGRLARFIPLFFAEEMQLSTEAQSIFVVPWLTSGGFFLNARHWKREQLKLEELHASFVLTMHVEAYRSPWNLQFSLLAAADGFIVDQWDQPVDAANPAPAVLSSLRRIQQSLALLEREPVSAELAVPYGAQLGAYLVGIEKALAISSAGLAPTNTIAPAERVVFDALLQLAKANPHNARARCLLVNSLNQATSYGMDVAAGYWQPLLQLQREHPIVPGHASTAVDVAVEKLRTRLQFG